jgi:UDP-glucose 4-epimerase
MRDRSIRPFGRASQDFGQSPLGRSVATLLSDMTTYLVTGAAGFIGSTLSDRLLAEGHRVVAVDNLSKGRILNLAEARGYGPQFTFQDVDVRSPGLGAIFDRHAPEVVMHLAAQSAVRRSIEEPSFDADVNIIGLLNVLRLAAERGARKVVFASSGGTIYGEKPKLPAKETARFRARPASPYGISKKVAEDYLSYYKRQHGVDYTALALGNVYGPRQDPHGEAGVVAIFGAKMLAGETPTIFGTGEQTRDYVFVDDVVHAFALAADSGSGKLVNIGTGIEASVNDLYRTLSDLTGFKGEPRLGPLQEGEVLRSSLDSSLAETELGWKPWTHLEDGLAETVAWLREGSRSS